MTTKEIYQKSIEEGIKNDFRDKKLIKEHLDRIKKKYKGLNKEKKKYFDRERLTNPYSDSRIHFEGLNPNKKIKKVMVGIDITGAEILTAKELGVDLVISHHPLGKALQGLDDVMQLQADVLEMYGVPINIAQGHLKKRISEVARGVHASNSYLVVDAARNLKMDLINVHTPSDNAVANFIHKKVELAKPRYVGEVIDLLYKIPEYQESARRGSYPALWSGSAEGRSGRVVVTEMTGGTEGARDIYEKLANAGIGTVIAMHQSEESRQNAEKSHINVVVAPHIASDSVGMNLVLDKVLDKGIEVIVAGGFIRVKRN